MLNIFSSGLHEVTEVYAAQEDLETTIASWSIKVVIGSGILVLLLVIAAWALNNRVPRLKLPLFIGISAIMALSTLSLIFSTVYLNVNSESGGPVHWHADFEVWACGNELEMRDPTGLSNKVGTSTLHEHNDHRVHLEGVVVEKHIDASLGKFMYVTGGGISDNSMVIPLNPGESYFEDEEDGDGPSNAYADSITKYFAPGDEKGDHAEFTSGGDCDGEPAEVQVFVYKFNEKDNTYQQTKLSRPQDYVITDDPNVPPGDCIIMEFGPSRDKTDKLCEQYGVRDAVRCQEFGVLPEDQEVCNIREVGGGMQ